MLAAMCTIKTVHHLTICIATFEPLIQIKSIAVDTGRNVSSSRSYRYSEAPVLCEQFYVIRTILGERVDGRGSAGAWENFKSSIA